MLALCRLSSAASSYEYSFAAPTTQVAAVLRICEAEVRRDYSFADRRAILQYVLLNPSERQRLGFAALFVDAPVLRPVSGPPPSPRTVAALNAAAAQKLIEGSLASVARLAQTAARLSDEEGMPRDDSFLSLVLDRPVLVPLKEAEADSEVSALVALHQQQLHIDHSSRAAARAAAAAAAADAQQQEDASQHRPQALVFSVRWPDARSLLSATPRLPPLLWERPSSGLTHGTVEAVTALLLPLLSTPSSVLRHLTSTWYDVVTRGALLVALPGSHADALRQSWRAVDPELLLATQSGHGDRVRGALLESWHAQAAEALAAFAQSYAVVVAAVSLPVQPTSATGTGGQAASSKQQQGGGGAASAAGADLDLDSIVDGDGPFSMPQSIRNQLSSDPRLRQQLRRLLVDYAEYLQVRGARVFGSRYVTG
jgi:hypothetical protein